MSTLCDPIPVKFEQEEDELIRGIHDLTDLSLNEIVRRAGRFALPLFATGKVDIANVRRLDPDEARRLIRLVSKGASRSKKR